MSSIPLLRRRRFRPDQLPGLKLWLDAERGVLTDGAVALAAASSQYLTIADNGSLSGADIDEWGACWFWRDSNADMGIMSKYVTGQREFVLEYYTNQQIYLTVSGDGDAVTSFTTGAISASAWHFVMWYHDATNNLIALSINGGAFVTTAHTAGIFNGTAPFELGRYNSVGHLDGRMDSACFGKSPSGGMAARATEIRDALYNGGSGRVYADLTATQKSDWGLVSWWNLNESTGTRFDSHGTNHLTPANTPGVTSGIAAGAAGDSDPVAVWQDQSGLGNHLTQATASKRPTLQTGANGQNGLPVVLCDGVDDELTNLMDFSAAEYVTIYFAGKLVSGAGNPCIYAITCATAKVDVQYITATTRYGQNTINSDQLYVTLDLTSAFRAFGNLHRNNAGNAYALWVDGASQSLSTSGTPANRVFSSGLALGSVGGSLYGNLRVGELLAYFAQHGQDEVDKVTGYLRRRWATA